MSIADKLTQIAENEQRVYNAGYEKGKAEAGPSGDSYYDTFWDAYQGNCERTSYLNAFSGAGWNDETFKPKYDFVCGSENSWSGAYSVFSGTGITDFDAAVQRAGVKVTFKGCIQSMFSGSKITKITLDCSNVYAWSAYPFLDCKQLVTAEIQNFNGNNDTKTMFQGCSALENLSFTGTSKLIRVTNLSDSPLLTKSSLLNVIDRLDSVTSATTLTLGATNLAKLTEEEIAVATEKGWTVV